MHRVKQEMGKLEVVGLVNNGPNRTFTVKGILHVYSNQIALGPVFTFTDVDSMTITENGMKVFYDGGQVAEISLEMVSAWSVGRSNPDSSRTGAFQKVTTIG